jgi:nucleoside-diphosphate-sugar epimerase
MSVALIAGVTGIVGLSVAHELVKKGWKVYGLSRQKSAYIPQEVVHHSVDLFDIDALKKLAHQLSDVTHIVFSTWIKAENEDENCKKNGLMIDNLLTAFTETAKLKHVALVTGTKHYLGPFESYAKSEPVTPFSEEHPRLNIANFYYTQEDILIAKAKQYGYNWSVSRPHTIIGYSPGNLMNLGTTIAVYATLCRRLKLPFTFPGSSKSYEGLVDVTDSQLLAEHIYWEMTTPQAVNLAYNVVNGDIFRWKFLWPTIAHYFQVEVGQYNGQSPLEPRFSKPEFEKEWEAIVKEHNLVPSKLNQIAPWWHTDADLGRPFECVNDMNRSKEHGWTGFRNSQKSFIQLFDKLRSEKIIPTL